MVVIGLFVGTLVYLFMLIVFSLWTGLFFLAFAGYSAREWSVAPSDARAVTLGLLVLGAALFAVNGLPVFGHLSGSDHGKPTVADSMADMLMLRGLKIEKWS